MKSIKAMSKVRGLEEFKLVLVGVQSVTPLNTRNEVAEWLTYNGSQKQTTKFEVKRWRTVAKFSNKKTTKYIR